MLSLKISQIHNEKVVYDKKVGQFNPAKRKFNAPKKIGVGGRVPAGNDRYRVIIQKNVMVDYENGIVRRETRAINWPTISRYIRDRDGKCLKCGATKNLQADHFHPFCYLWINWFFRVSKIQCLCYSCHVQMPSMIKRAKNWRKFCYRT